MVILGLKLWLLNNGWVCQWHGFGKCMAIRIESKFQIFYGFDGSGLTRYQEKPWVGT